MVPVVVVAGVVVVVGRVVVLVVVLVVLVVVIVSFRLTSAASITSKPSDIEVSVDEPPSTTASISIVATSLDKLPS